MREKEIEKEGEGGTAFDGKIFEILHYHLVTGCTEICHQSSLYIVVVVFHSVSIHFSFFCLFDEGVSNIEASFAIGNRRNKKMLQV